MDDITIISSDSHVIEPADLWTTRLDPALREQGPRLVAEGDGDWWYCEGKRLRAGPASGAQAGVRFEHPERLGLTARFDDVREGAYKPEKRLEDMDLDGLSGDVIYPTLGLGLFGGVGDSDLLTSVCAAYNDWLSEYCSVAPGKLKGIALVNTDDIADAVAELERVHGQGLAGAMITVFPPVGRAYDRPEYEPLWAKAEELDIPLSLHISSNRLASFTGALATYRMAPQDGPAAALFANADFWVRVSLGAIILAGVFERHPRMRIVSAEHELAWVPHFLERLDYTYTQRTREILPPRFKSDRVPSDFFHENVLCSFQEDALGMRQRDLIGVENLMWGSDYPHVEGTFPRSREVIERVFEGVPDDERVKILASNAARLYRFN